MSEVGDERFKASLLAKYLVAMRHPEIPSVFDQTPESLTDVDLHFWLENFPETFERQLIDQRAVPTVGAYLGQVLVRHLGARARLREGLQGEGAVADVYPLEAGPIPHHAVPVKVYTRAHRFDQQQPEGDSGSPESAPGHFLPIRSPGSRALDCRTNMREGMEW